MLHNNTVTFVWEIMEFTFKEKRKLWYWVVGISALVLITISLFLKNYLFAFFILIAAGLMIKIASKQPIVLPIEISDHGVKINQDLYGYEMLHHFWIQTNPKNQAHTLLFLSDRRISPVISIEIAESIDPMDIREYLLNFIPEQEMKESVTNRIIDRIGF